MSSIIQNQTFLFPELYSLLVRSTPWRLAANSGLSQRRKSVVAMVVKKKEDLPLQQRVLSGFLNLSSTPYSSYIPSPKTFLHTVDPRIKQIGTVYLLFLLTSTGPIGQSTLAAWLLILTLCNSPWRITKPTLLPLLTMSVFYFVLTAALADGSPPGLQSHIPSSELQGLPSLPPKPYTYVLFKFWFITVSKKSIRLAITTVCLVFVALQSASLCLMTTPPEQLALSLRQLLWPLRIFRVPVNEIGFGLLLSIRFLSSVFDEIRNLALGLAVRGIDWNRLGNVGSINLVLSTITQLFRKLFQTSENVAQALVARGFQGPEHHHLYLMADVESSKLANVVSILTLIGLSLLVFQRG